MSDIVISPYRLLPNNVANNLDLKQHFEFLSTGPDPGARRIAGRQYTLGSDSDWTADSHDLIVKCSINAIPDLTSLFGSDGIAAKDATLLLALEWTSADSGARQLGQPKELSLEQWPASGESVVLSLQLAAGSIRGIGTISLQLFLGRPGTPAATDLGIAVQRGFNFGILGTAITLVIDGDSSLFPILEQSCGADGPLWEFRENWTDPLEDEFSSEYVSLVLNSDHEHFEQLRERRDGSAKQTPLMRQVLASWISMLIAEVMKKLGRDFAELVSGNSRVAEPYSIAETAAGFVRSGELDTSSLSTLFASTNRWLDQRVREAEVPK